MSNSIRVPAMGAERGRVLDAGDAAHAGHHVGRLGEPVVVEIDWRARHGCAAVGAAQVQGMAAFRQHFVRKFDTEPVPAIANAALQELRPMVARDRRDQGGFAIDQLEPDPLSGRLWIPDPAVDRSPVHRVDLTLKPAICLEWLKRIFAAVAAERRGRYRAPGAAGYFRPSPPMPMLSRRPWLLARIMQLVPLLRSRGPQQLASLSVVSHAAEFVPSNPLVSNEPRPPPNPRGELPAKWLRFSYGPDRGRPC